MSAETKRKTKFFIFGSAECSSNLCKVTTNECRNKKKNEVFYFWFCLKTLSLGL